MCNSEVVITDWSAGYIAAVSECFHRGTMQSSEEGETKFCMLPSALCFLCRGSTWTSTCTSSLSLCCLYIVVMLFGEAGERNPDLGD